MTDFSTLQKYSDTQLEEHRYLMQTVGYNLFPDFYPESLCDLFKERLENAVERYEPVQGSERSEKDRYHIHDLLCKDLLFLKAFEDPRLQQVVATVLGDFWILYAYTTSSLPPTGGKNYGSRVHIDSPRFIPNYPTNVGLLWALDDFTIENGATKLLPGSHNCGDVPSEELFEKHCEVVTCKKGSLMIFNARVFHRAGVNKTESWRHSLTLNACRPYMKQRMDWVRFIPTEMADELNSQARRIIGYDTRLPSSLEEFFVPEEQRLYKSNQE